MKYLIFLSCLMLVGCGAGPGTSSGSKLDQASQVTVSGVLSASRDNAVFSDGNLSVARVTQFTVPSVLNAAQGANEAGRIVLSFGVTDCYYQTGAQLGRYDFQSCLDGSNPGDSLSVQPTTITLHLESGYTVNHVLVELTLNGTE